MDHSTQTFYLKCSEYKAEATLTATEVMATKLLTRCPSWCRCSSPKHTKMIPGKLKTIASGV